MEKREIRTTSEGLKYMCVYTQENVPKGCGPGASLPLLSPPLVPYPWGRLLKKNKRIKKKKCPQGIEWNDKRKSNKLCLYVLICVKELKTSCLPDSSVSPAVLGWKIWLVCSQLDFKQRRFSTFLFRTVNSHPFHGLFRAVFSFSFLCFLFVPSRFTVALRIIPRCHLVLLSSGRLGCASQGKYTIDNLWSVVS